MNALTMKHNEDWFARQAKHAQEAIAEAERRHTEQEVAEAEAALAVDPQERQQSLIEVLR